MNGREACVFAPLYPQHPDCLAEGDIVLRYDPALVKEDMTLKLPDTVIARKGTDRVTLGKVSDQVGMYKIKIGAGGRLIYRVFWETRGSALRGTAWP